MMMIGKSSREASMSARRARTAGSTIGPVWLRIRLRIVRRGSPTHDSVLHC